MADKTIEELSKATELKDEDSFPIEQDGEPRRGTVGQLKDVAKSVAQPFADEAAKSAETAAEKANDAADVALHPPIIREGKWWTWNTDTNDYADSGEDAGLSLAIGIVTTGEPGTVAKVANRGTPTDQIWDITLPRGDPGQVKSVNGGTGDVVIGGRNLLDLTNQGERGWSWLLEQGHASYSSVYTMGTNCVKLVRDNTENSGYSVIFYKPNIENSKSFMHRLMPDTYYTVSFWVCPSVSVFFDCYLADEGGGNACSDRGYFYLDSTPNSRNAPANQWTKLVCTIRTIADFSSVVLGLQGIYLIPSDKNVGISYIFKDLKLERGTVATDWTPAPEDYLGPFNAYNIPNMHRNIFRGQSLGSTFTDAQKAAIAAGTWDDLYLGDYWTIGGHAWRIADFDYWLGKGDTPCTKHHIVVVPDAPLYSAQMHNTDSGAYEAETTANSTEGGYFNSDMRTTNLARAKTLIETDFGAGSILNHRILLTNSVKDGYPSGGTWYDSEVDLMNEMMVYGAYHFAPRGNGTIIPYNYTAEHTQLALFQAVPYYIMPNRSWYWLRDVVSDAGFAVVDGTGMSYFASASIGYGVRPAVGIVGA